MVEMTETANILHNANKRSLVILDEIGRGTSTYDGISIAWAVAEHLLSKQSKTLFATHYWELTELEKKATGAINFNVAVHESEKEITFLRKIVRGSADKSYGIHVARLAGFPPRVLKRAQEILQQLESKDNAPPKKSIKESTQFSLFHSPAPHIPPWVEELKKLDINQLTPLEAFKKLIEWQSLI
jgi:DNA mismatch repair protein MutS